jgi:hypothetical protein
MILFLSYLIISFVVFAPLTSSITNSAPGSGGTAYQNLWDIWWVGYSMLALHTGVFFTPLLYTPVGANLIYQNLSPVAALVSLPFQAISLAFAYNTMLLLGFVLSGITMFILADYIVDDRRAAFVAGLVFAFSSFHIAQGYFNLGLINIEWVPLALYFFIKMIKGEPTYLNAAGLGLSFMLASLMGSVQQGIELAMLLVLVACAYLLVSERRKRILSAKLWAFVGLAAAIAFLVGAAWFVPILEAALQPGGLAQANAFNNVTYNSAWSDSIASFFIPSYYNGIFDSNPSVYFTSVFAPTPSERVAYVGYVTLLLALYGLYIDYKRSRLWLGLAVIFGILCLGPSGLLYSLYHLLPGINIISEPDRFYLVFSLAMAILAAFGFKDLFGRMKLGKQGGMAILAVLSIVTIAIIVENNGIALSAPLYHQVAINASIPYFYRQLGTSSANFSVLELPVLDDQYYSNGPSLFTGIAAYYDTAAHKPILGGYLGLSNDTQKLTLCNIPLVETATYLEQSGGGAQLSLCTYGTNGVPTYTVDKGGVPVSPSLVVQNPANESLLLLDDYGTAYVAINNAAYNRSALVELGNYLYGLFGAPVYQDNSTIVFSTVNASKYLYRSYVAYPILNQWEAAQELVNGTLQYFWTPIKNYSALYGGLIVSAPYAKQTNTSAAIESTSVSYINTSMTIDAGTNFGDAQLVVEGIGLNGNPVRIANLSVSPAFAAYTINASLVSGPQGNTLFFLQRVAAASAGKQQLIFIKNITIQRGR